MMDVTRAILPHFRANHAGTIVNVSSGAGAIRFPMASLYSSSKFALEGFSEGLSYELGSIGIKVKIIEPGGAMKTSFMARVGQEHAGVQPPADYLPFLEHIGKVYGAMGEMRTRMPSRKSSHRSSKQQTTAPIGCATRRPTTLRRSSTHAAARRKIDISPSRALFSFQSKEAGS